MERKHVSRASIAIEASSADVWDALVNPATAKVYFFGAEVHFDVLDVTERQGRTIVTIRVDGTFDRTGLPNPLVMKHEFGVAEGKIAVLRIGF